MTTTVEQEISPMDIWTIDGEQYDMRAFMDRHPGGRTAIELGRGQDCTTLFHTYHTNLGPNSPHVSILQKYKLKNKVKTNVMPSDSLADDVLYNQLRAELHRFSMEKYGGAPSEALKIPLRRAVLSLVWFVAHLYFLFQWVATGDLKIAVLAALTQMFHGLQTSHDGSHFAVSRSPLVNEISVWMALPFGFHPIFWYVQHVIQHHVYTNDVGDVDLVHLAPIGRLSPLARWKPLYKLNGIMAAIFLPLMATVAETMQYPTRMFLSWIRGDLHKAKVLRGVSNKQYFMFGSPKKVIQFVISLSVSLGLYLLVLYKHGFLSAFAPWFVTGIYFTAVTQVSHLQEECQVADLEAVGPDGKKVLPWSHRQILHTVDYNPTSDLWNFFTGGLNTQSIHHLFPTVHHAHYIDLWPRFARIMALHGIKIQTRPSIFHALFSWARWMHKLGKKNAVASKTKKSDDSTS